LTNNTRDLKTLEVDLTGLSYVLPDNNPDSGIFVIDTADLIGALLGEGAGDKRSLEKTCGLLQIPTHFLHNAGNDAHVNLSNDFFKLLKADQRLADTSIPSLPCKPWQMAIQ